MTGSEILSLPVGCERLLVSSDSASLDLLQDTLAARQKCGPLRRQADVSGAAVEQPDPQFMLKPGDILTHRRGRYAQQPGGLNKA